MDEQGYKSNCEQLFQTHLRQWSGFTERAILPRTEGALAILKKMTPCTIHYLQKIALKNRWVSASYLAKGLSMEIGVSVTDHSAKDIECGQPLWTTSKKKTVARKTVQNCNIKLCQRT